VPISAHALFAGPMVVSPRSVLAAEVIGAVGGHSETAGAVLWCDGRRMVELPPGARVEVRRGSLPVLLARLPAVAGEALAEAEAGAEARIGAPFTDRLVAKFGLPVAGWRGLPGDREITGEATTRVERGETDVVARDVADRADEETGGHA